MTKKLSRQALQRLEVLYNDFPTFAENCLFIRTKLEGIVPFKLNSCQKYIHKRLEKQLKEKGWVRAIILKARQEGCSTYIGGRFYRKTSWEKGIRAFILAHRDDATANLFKMTRRFHKHMPKALKSHTSYSNRQELVFDVLDSSYGLGTAGSGEIGRSDTIQLFHGSEVASWANADALVAGIFEAVPEGPGTEIILESTAKGMGNFFHREWNKSEAGMSDYMPIFIPWFWQKEYSREVPEDFVLSEEEKEYKKLYKLTDEQMVWRRAKIIQLGDPLLFNQEYPATAAEAFQTTGHDSFIGPDVILRARKASVKEAFGPIVVGVDPATGTAKSKGNDYTAIAIRQGPVLWSVDKYDDDEMGIVGRCKLLLDVEGEKRVAKMFVDVGGVGSGIVSRLREMGYNDRVVPVNFGSDALNKVRYKNRRAEMWGTLKEWLDDPVQASLPDKDSLQADLTAPGITYSSSGQIILEPKEKIRLKLGSSPDEGDATALTFAQPVRNDAAILVTTAQHSFRLGGRRFGFNSTANKVKHNFRFNPRGL